MRQSRGAGSGNAKYWSCPPPGGASCAVVVASSILDTALNIVLSIADGARSCPLSICERKIDMEQKQQYGRLVSALIRAVVPAALGALGAIVASLLPVQFAAFCNGMV